MAQLRVYQTCVADWRSTTLLLYELTASSSTFLSIKMELCGGRRLLTGLLLPLFSFASAQLPYNPTRLLQLPENGSTVFAFRPTGDESELFQLHKIDASDGLDPSDIQYSILTDSLPFIKTDSPNAFLPVISGRGDISVYSGKCESGQGNAEIWRLSWADEDKREAGEWLQESLSVDISEDGANLSGANFLASAISFSSSPSSSDLDAAIFSFGGMCPSAEATLETWQSNANYSNLLVAIKQENGASPSSHTLGLASNRGAPISEAGFSITPLQPLFSNNSDGPAIQQQDFVLIGGHTDTAFINTSQVALFSLPQENWSFLPIEQPSDQQRDLAVRDDIAEIEPRSGHTAVLSEDGKSIVLFGGWIGDVNTIASPQLAILTLGDGYGGEGSWKWTAPKQSENAPSSGIYGHGAIMLPGNVMLVLGGYEISETPSRLRERAESRNWHGFLYNVTSGTWVTRYIPPFNADTESDDSQSGPLSSKSQKIGLGAGLGIGAAAILCLFIFYLIYSRRLEKERETREEDLKTLALDAQRFCSTDLGRSGVDSRGDDISTIYDDDNSFSPTQSRGNGQHGWKAVQGRDAERTGLLVEIPSPTRGLRRSLHGRPQSQITFDSRRSRGAGGIHPIDERGEEDDSVPLAKKDAGKADIQEMTKMKDHDGFAASLISRRNSATLDTNPLGSHPIQAESSVQPLRNRSATDSHSRHRSLDLISWVNDWQQTADALLLNRNSSTSSSGGRISPSKSERTESNLSEKSIRSTFSYRSGGTGHMKRSVSLRSATLLHNTTNPFATPEPSPTSENGPASSDDSESPRHQSMNSNVVRPGTRDNDGDSFSTAKTSFAQLQAEGEALLGSRQANIPNSAARRPRSEIIMYPPNDLVLNRGRNRGWMGSVRRVLGRNRAEGSRRISLTADESLAHIYNSTSSSPTKQVSPNGTSHVVSVAKPAPPRRAASDASYLQSKRGARDWGIGSPDGPTSALEKAFPPAWERKSGDDWGSPEDRERFEQDEQRAGEDWDVESAAERRVVQVVYTVPKQKLRVVNADEPIASRQGSSENLQTSSTQSKIKGKGKERAEE